MPVLITHNIAAELHISNDSIGRLVTVVYEDEEQSYDATAISDPTFPSHTMYVGKPLYALVQLPQCKLASGLTDLQLTIIPIVPEQKKIVTKQSNHQDYSLSVSNHSCLCNDNIQMSRQNIGIWCDRYGTSTFC
jgi:hypothetical protein